MLLVHVLYLVGGGDAGPAVDEHPHGVAVPMPGGHQQRSHPVLEQRIQQGTVNTIANLHAPVHTAHLVFGLDVTLGGDEHVHDLRGAPGGRPMDGGATILETNSGVGQSVEWYRYPLGI